MQISEAESVVMDVLWRRHPSGAEDVVANDKLDARFECAPSVFSRRQLGAYR